MPATCQICEAVGDQWAIGKGGLLYCPECWVPGERQIAYMRGAVHKGTVSAKASNVRSLTPPKGGELPTLFDTAKETDA